MTLFLKECKKILKSYIYYIFIGVVLLFYVSQMGMTNSEAVKKYATPPERVDIKQYYAENHRYPYGNKYVEPSIETIPNISKELYNDYRMNRYQTYPFGFCKIVRLDKDEIVEIAKVLTEITGESIAKLDEIYIVNYKNLKLPVSSSLTIGRLNELMESVDKLLGGGSNYSNKNIVTINRIPVTYEEALKDYEYLLNNDKITNGYARLFCDYIGIAMAIFPIFVVVAMVQKDKRSKMNELIYSRNTSSIKLILSRYFALVIMMIIPILLISLEPLIGFIRFSKNVPIDNFAFIKYILWWILPTLMLVTAIGLFLTILTATPVAIAVQLFIWFLSVFNIGLTGDYPMFGLLIRHNGGQMGTLIRDNAGLITMNRLVITGLALILVILTTYIYELKRRGKLDFSTKFRKRFKVNSNKSKA